MTITRPLIRLSLWVLAHASNQDLEAVGLTVTYPATFCGGRSIHTPKESS